MTSRLYSDKDFHGVALAAVGGLSNADAVVVELFLSIAHKHADNFSKMKRIIRAHAEDDALRLRFNRAWNERCEIVDKKQAQILSRWDPPDHYRRN